MLIASSLRQLIRFLDTFHLIGLRRNPRHETRIDLNRGNSILVLTIVLPRFRYEFWACRAVLRRNSVKLCAGWRSQRA